MTRAAKLATVLVVLVGACSSVDGPAPPPDHGGAAEAEATDASLDDAAGAPRMPWIEVAPNGVDFQVAGTGERFFSNGLNYATLHDKGLVEEVWETDYEEFVEGFSYIKSLGGNVVRLLFSVGPFMSSPTEVNDAAFAKLAELADAADAAGVHIQIVGLGIYRESAAPAWYFTQTEAAHWDTHARFWSEAAKTLKDKPSVFAYDLMNEPVAFGEATTDLTPGEPLGGYAWVQAISQNPDGRDGRLLAEEWTAKMVGAIREHDTRHLVTIGVIAYRGGPFGPTNVTEHLDFVSPHIYPQRGDAGQALDDFAAYARVGKPVVIGETFSLFSTVPELEWFMLDSAHAADGFMLQYTGLTIEDMTPPDDPVDEIMTAGLEAYVDLVPWLGVDDGTPRALHRYFNSTTLGSAYAVERDDDRWATRGYTHVEDLGRLHRRNPGDAEALCQFTNDNDVYEADADCDYPAGFAFEQVLGWAPRTGSLERTAIYQYSHALHGPVWTANRDDASLIDGGWSNDGVAFYTLA